MALSGTDLESYITRYTSIQREKLPDSHLCHREGGRGSDFFIDNLLVRIHSIIEIIWWTGLAPCEFPLPGSLVSIYLPRGRKKLSDSHAEREKSYLTLFFLPAYDGTREKKTN